MQEKRIDTVSLLQRLLKTTSIGHFLRLNKSSVNSLPTFSNYVNDLCSQKGVTAESIIKNSNIERTYGHKFFNGTRLPSRDRVIQIAFGFGMNYEGAQRLLTIARKSQLHPKVERDAVIIFALNKELGIADTQSMLRDLGLPGFGKEPGDE